MRAARSDSLRMVSRPRRTDSSMAVCCDSRSAQLRIVASGLFSSWATPEIVCPSAAIFSACRSCAEMSRVSSSSFLRSLTSRTSASTRSAPAAVAGRRAP